MSTQNSGHKPTAFSVCTPFQHVRLLEVPNDLLDIITTSSQPLKFKSSSLPPQTGSSTSNTNASQKDGIVHLCSADKAWAVKQVSTSNSVYMIRPTKPVPSTNFNEEDTAMDLGTDTDETQLTPPDAAVSAIAQAGSFLELHATAIDTDAIEATITNILPVWDTQDASRTTNLDLQRSNDSKPALTLSQLIDEIPAPDDIVTQCIARLGVFEIKSSLLSPNPLTETPLRAVLPSTNSILKAWTHMIEQATCEEISLDATDFDITRILTQLDDEIDAAILRRLFTSQKHQGTFNVNNIFESSHTTREWKALDLCRFVARLILSSESSSTSTKTEPGTARTMDREGFLNCWTDLVPVSFVKLCTLDLLLHEQLKGEFSLATDADKGKECVRWNGPVASHGVVFLTAFGKGAVGVLESAGGSGTGNAVTTATTGTASSTAAVDKKRKWHEKFGAQRNLKR